MSEAEDRTLAPQTNTTTEDTSSQDRLTTAQYADIFRGDLARFAAAYGDLLPFLTDPIDGMPYGLLASIRRYAEERMVSLGKSAQHMQQLAERGITDPHGG